MTKLSVADQAMKVAREAEVARQRVAEDERKARLRVREEKAASTLAHSPLGEWFPDEEFDIIDFASKGTAIGIDAHDGSACVVTDKQRSVLLLLQHDKAMDGTIWAPPRVYLVERKTDTDTHYSYYDGPEVRSVEDIGKAMIARLEHERQRQRHERHERLAR